MTFSATGTQRPAGDSEPTGGPRLAGKVERMDGPAEVELRPPRYVSIAEPPRPVEPGVETAIVLQVTAALLADPPTELTLIEVNSEQGIVTLKGQVGDARLHTMAGQIASRHPGVEGTVNDLEIREREAPDRETDAPG